MVRAKKNFMSSVAGQKLGNKQTAVTVSIELVPKGILLHDPKQFNPSCAHEQLIDLVVSVN